MAKHTALLLGGGTIGAEVARLLVADEVFSGVLISPEALDPRPFLETLDRWGVRLRFRREVETDRFL